jgi:hypothetical protein
MCLSRLATIGLVWLHASASRKQARAKDRHSEGETLLAKGPAQTQYAPVWAEDQQYNNAPNTVAPTAHHNG